MTWGVIGAYLEHGINLIGPKLGSEARKHRGGGDWKKFL